MDENNSRTAELTAPEKTEKDGRSKGYLVFLLLGFALILLLSCAFLFTLRVGNRRYLCTGTVDARGQELSAAEIEKAAERRPDVPIRWSVPIGEERFDSFSEILTLTSLPENALDDLGYFPYLQVVDARECHDEKTLAAAAARYDTVRFLWNVESAGGSVDGNTTTLVPPVLDARELDRLVSLLPKLETVDLRRTVLSDDEVDAFAAAHPELETLFTVRVWGQEVPGDSELLRLSPSASGETDELLAAMGRLKKLKKLDLRDCAILPGQLAELLPRCEGIETDYVVHLCGAVFTTDVEELDLSGVPIDDLQELENAVRMMPNLKKVVMCDCGVSNEDMDALNRRFENVRFIWRVYFSIYSLRTDATMFCASDVPQLNYLAPELTDAELEPIKYCTDLEALDLGHMLYTDLSFLYNMPRLKYLILVEARYHDITPIGSLEDLEYLEIFINKIDDISPLLNCKKLKHLNMCYCWGFDAAPLLEMTWLERLWYVGTALHEPVRSQLAAALPNTQVYIPYADNQGSTGGGWRENEAYFAMRDVFGMYYQPGGTGIH